MVTVVGGVRCGDSGGGVRCGDSGGTSQVGGGQYVLLLVSCDGHIIYYVVNWVQRLKHMAGR